MKRTNPSVSTLLQTSPTSHAKLPPISGSLAGGSQFPPESTGALPPLRGSADGAAAHAATAAGTNHLPGAARWSDADCAHTSHAAASISADTEQQQQAQHPSYIQEQVWPPSIDQLQDHLLLRQPTLVTSIEHEPRASLQDHQQWPSTQQQHNSLIDSLKTQQLRRLSRPSKEDQTSAAAGSSRQPSSWQSRRVRLLALLDCPGTSWVLMVMTLFVIFQEDFKYAVLPPPADLGFEAATLALLILFLIEIGCSCLVRPGFFMSFYFWLDTVAVLSLAFELPALRAVLLLGATQEYVDLNSADNYLMAAGAQALVSSKAGRAAKMVRLFRQLQLIRLFKQLEVRQRLKRALQADALDLQAAVADGLAAIEAQVMAKYQGAGQSRVGQRLSDLTMKRVISGVLAMLIVLPALEISSGINGRDTPLALGGLQMLHNQALTGGSTRTAFNSSMKAFQESIKYELAGQKTGDVLLLVVANHTYIHNKVSDQVSFTQHSNISSSPPRPSQYRRYLEMQAVAHSSWVCPVTSQVVTREESALLTLALGIGPDYAIVDASTAAAAASLGLAGNSSAAGDVMPAFHTIGCQNFQSFVLLDVKWALQAQSVYGIARTLFLACLLAVGAMLIHQDTFKLVLQPVQRMVERVREMAEDPLMQAAVRINPAAAITSNSGSGVAETGSNNVGKAGIPAGAVSRCSTLAAAGCGAGGSALLAKEQLRQSSQALNSTSTSRLSTIRFWPAVRIHAVAEDASFDAAGSSADGSNPKRAALTSKVAQLQQRMSRASGTQLLLAGTRRLSVGISAGVSAAGVVAAKLGQQLRARTSALKQLVLGTAPDNEEEAAQGQYETRLLEQSIYKICALLAVGFGDAGAEVIAENIKKEGDLNPIVPGKKMVAVFGFCDIRRFTDTTEVLQEGVMEFVNTIAHLVHGAVAARGGAANKNIGDAFLLVWKLPKGLDEQDVSLISSGGGNRNSSGNGAGASRLRSATTLNWPGLGDAGSGSDSDEDDQQQQNHHKGSSSNLVQSGSQANSNAGSRTASPTRTSGMGGNIFTVGPAGVGSSCSGESGAEELSRQLSTAMHQQLTLKRAASGMADLLPHSKQHNSSMLIHARSNANSDAGGQQSLSTGGGGPQRSASSSLGLRRAVMSLKSVKPMQLSTAAKTTIINTIADNALASFVVIQVAISVSRLLGRYSQRPDLNARMPGFRVQMGFGLHVGWAIEGAIGSEYKIDASYLSPNVNLASRLEAATKQYGVPLLLSRDFVDCLSPAVRAKVRQIDCVMVKGSNQPLGLFCYDLDMDAAKAAVRLLAAAPSGTHANSSATTGSPSCSAGVPQQRASRDDSTNAQNTSSAVTPAGGLLPGVRHSLAVLPGAASAARSSVVMTAGSQAWNTEGEGAGLDEAELLLSQDYEDDWLDNPVLANSWGLTWTFKEDFEEAYQLYAAGKWSAAKAAFESCLHSRSTAAGQQVEDGPSRTLLEVMAAHAYQAPSGWNGVRELTEK